MRDKRRSLFLVTATVCLLAALTCPTTSRAAARVAPATVAHVSDGDTLVAYTAHARFRVRLLGIDAPEIAYNGVPGQPYGKEARDYLERLVDRPRGDTPAGGRGARLRGHRGGVGNLEAAGPEGGGPY